MEQKNVRGHLFADQADPGRTGSLSCLDALISSEYSHLPGGEEQK